MPLLRSPGCASSRSRCSGRANLTTHLADLGADVIKVEPPQGDYGRQMTWPIVKASRCCSCTSAGASAASCSTCAPTRAARRSSSSCATPTRSSRRCGRAGSSAAGSASRRCARSTRRSCSCTISGYGMTGPYRDMPSHGIAYDVWAGIVAAQDRRRTASRTCPSTCRSASTPVRSSARSGLLAGVLRARETGEGCQLEIAQSDAAAAIDWLRSETWHGVRTPAVGGHRQRGRQLRAARAGHRRHGSGRPLPVLRDHRRVHPVHGVRARVLEELLRGRRPARPVRALARLAVRRPRARQHRAARDPARRSSRRRSSAGVARVRPEAQHADRAVEHAEDDPRRPAVPGPLAVDPGVEGRRRHAAHARSSSSARRCPIPTMAPTVGQHTEPVLREVLGWDDAQIAAAREAGAFGKRRPRGLSAPGRVP